MEKIANTLPDEMKKELLPYLSAKKDSEEYKIVKAADKLSAYIKCLEEFACVNTATDCECSIIFSSRVERINCQRLINFIRSIENSCQSCTFVQVLPCPIQMVSSQPFTAPHNIFFARGTHQLPALDKLHSVHISIKFFHIGSFRRCFIPISRAMLFDDRQIKFK